jgi:beta-N-acetylhexosaminidase
MTFHNFSLKKRYVCRCLAGFCLFIFTSCMTQKSYITNRCRRTVASLSMEEKAGQFFILSLREDTEGNRRPDAVTTVDDEVKKIMEAVHPGGVVLYAENIVSPDQTVKLISDLQSLSDIPLFIAVDEEGGRVSRIGSNPVMQAPVIPANYNIGQTKNPELAYKEGYIIGSELNSLGFNLAFSVIADIFTNSKNTVIGDRSFGSEQNTVADYVAEEVQGIQQSPVAAVLKHFPGHGDTDQDSHDTVAVSARSLEQLRTVEFVPFEAGIGQGSMGVMVGHIVVPGVTEDGRPAAFSSRIMQDILRRDLGFNGIIITDSLEMAGATYPGLKSTDRAVESFLSGADMLLTPPYILKSYRTFLEECKNGHISSSRLYESLERIWNTKVKLGLIMGSPSFEEIPSWKETLGCRKILEPGRELSEAVNDEKKADESAKK